MIDLLLITWLAAVGAAVGSFLNVVIYRLPRGESLVSPPSHCPKCNHPIRFYDNIPIFGWLLLNGKCRDCKQPISFRYPLIEVVACLVIATFSCLIFNPKLDFIRPVWEMILEIPKTNETVSDFVIYPMSLSQIIIRIGWLSALHLYLLTLGMIEFDRQTLSQRSQVIFLLPFVVFGAFFPFLFPVPWLSVWPLETVVEMYNRQHTLGLDTLSGVTEMLIRCCCALVMSFVIVVIYCLFVRLENRIAISNVKTHQKTKTVETPNYSVFFRKSGLPWCYNGAGMGDSLRPCTNALRCRGSAHSFGDFKPVWVYLWLGVFLCWQLALIAIVCGMILNVVIFFSVRYSYPILTLAAASFIINVALLL